MATHEQLLNMLCEIRKNTPTCHILAEQPLSRLRYSIVEASSYSGVYEPHNILYDRPHDLGSRWSGAAVASIAPSVMSSSSNGSGNGVGTPSGSSQRSSSPLYGGKPGSRYSGKSSPLPDDKQYIILQLDKPSILKKIFFGKYHKAHPCNLKDFKVYGSQTTKDPHSNAWVRILRGGLRNDSHMEFFETKWKTSEGVPFPVRYVKLVPLATHSPNYNFSVWHIALEGVTDSYTLKRITKDYQEHRESIATRLILRHLRSRAYDSAFQTLLESCNLDAPEGISEPRELASLGFKRPFEHPIVTQLYNSLMQGAWDAAESCLEKAAWGDPPISDDGVLNRGSSTYSETSSNLSTSVSLFTSFVDESMPKATWSPIAGSDRDGNFPCGRGGHEMAIDCQKGIIWLFGGWDGEKDLCDLWAYYIEEDRWRCVSDDVRCERGPGPRSCHKMVFDPRTGFLYVLGKFVEYDKVPPTTTSLGSTPAGAANAGAAAATPSSQRGSSPADRAAPTAASTSNRSATRGFFLPRVAGTAEGSPGPGGNAAESPSELADELFGSTRGGSTRLSSGRTTFLGVDRASRGVGVGGEENAESGNNTPSVGSPAPSGISSTSSHISGYESDFYRFSTRLERWDQLSADTSTVNGPKLLFDHQMVIDPDSQHLYVFGGRVAHPDSSKVEFSGMWRYDVIHRCWSCLFSERSPSQARIPSRAGHTMILDVAQRNTPSPKKHIWIIGGRRHNQSLSDMWTYQPGSGTVKEVHKNFTLNNNGPEGGYPQRAAIDTRAREIYLFSGLIKKSKNKGERVESALWIYSIERDNWRLVYQQGDPSVSSLGGLGSDEGGEGENRDGDTNMEAVEPGEGPIYAFPTDLTPAAEDSTRDSSSGAMQTADFRKRTFPEPRITAQLIYDKRLKRFYIFGGNPNYADDSSFRLNDFWSLELKRPGLSEVLRKAKFKLRQQRFLELAHSQDASGSGSEGAMRALLYLQNEVSQVVNHGLPEESAAFQKLMAHLLRASTGKTDEEEGPSFMVPHCAEFLSNNASSKLAPASVLLPTEKTDRGARSGVSSDDASEEEGDEEEETEMLSISQVIPKTTFNYPTHASSPRPLLLGAEGEPSPLFNQRYQLFQTLLKFFPKDSIEPDIDLLDCIESSKLSC
ncbi:hypothetical protein CBS101457_001831 [Exobasidium rhododendri]|nr:hypothetical protein CBS101457_001831 [Exobasidium rhododendri]